MLCYTFSEWNIHLVLARRGDCMLLHLLPQDPGRRPVDLVLLCGPKLCYMVLLYFNTAHPSSLSWCSAVLVCSFGEFLHTSYINSATLQSSWSITFFAIMPSPDIISGGICVHFYWLKRKRQACCVIGLVEKFNFNYMTRLLCILMGNLILKLVYFLQLFELSTPLGVILHF